MTKVRETGWQGKEESEQVNEIQKFENLGALHVLSRLDNDLTRQVTRQS